MAGIEELLVSIVSKLDDAGFKQLDKMESKADKATRVLSNNLRNMFVGVIGSIGAKEIIDASVKLDSLKTSFAALAGSDTAGAEQLKYLREETQRLGQDFLTSAEAYKNLFSAGRGVGMSTDEIQKVFSSVLEAGTVLGSSQQQMQGALMALEQMISKGKVSMEELRRQLGNALPGAMHIAARAMGTTSQGLQEMLEAGLDSQKFVTAFSNQLHDEFGGKAVEASHTLRAELARLNNAIFDVKTSFLDGEAGEAFADTIKQLVEVLKSPELTSSLQGISQFLTFLLKNIKPIMAILGFLFANMAIGKAAKGVVSFLGFAGGALKTGRNLLILTQGLKWLPRIWEIIKLAWWALNPLKKIELIIWLIVGAVAFFKWWAKKEENKKKPIWVKDADGYWRDVNEDSPTYGQKGINLTDDLVKHLQDIEKMTGVKSDILVTPIGDSSGKVTGGAADIGYKGELPNLNQSSNNNTNNISINISTNSDNPQGIGEAVRTAMLDVFESVRIRNGYPQTEVV